MAVLRGEMFVFKVWPCLCLPSPLAQAQNSEHPPTSPPDPCPASTPRFTEQPLGSHQTLDQEETSLRDKRIARDRTISLGLHTPPRLSPWCHPGFLSHLPLDSP